MQTNEEDIVRWLILLQSKDRERWKLPPDGYMPIEAENTSALIVDWSVANNHSDDFANILNSFDNARVWAHFGSANSNSLTRELIDREWNKTKPKYCQQASDRVNPFSMTSHTLWDLCLQALAGTMCEGNERAQATSIVRLRKAWTAANQYYYEIKPLLPWMQKAFPLCLRYQTSHIPPSQDSDRQRLDKLLSPEIQMLIQDLPSLQPRLDCGGGIAECMSNLEDLQNPGKDAMVPGEFHDLVFRLKTALHDALKG